MPNPRRFGGKHTPEGCRKGRGLLGGVGCEPLSAIAPSLVVRLEFHRCGSVTGEGLRASAPEILPVSERALLSRRKNARATEGQRAPLAVQRRFHHTVELQANLTMS